MERLVTPAIAGLTLVGGFLVAQGTGSRPLGGAVLVAGAVWCVLREVRRTAVWRLAVVVLVAVVCFGVSHPLAGAIGTWPAVLAAAAVTAVATWSLLGLSLGARPRGHRPHRTSAHRST